MTAARTSTCAALRAEWIEVSTLRSTAVLLASTAVIGWGVAWAVAVFVTDEVLLASEVFTYSTVFSALLASIGGILLITAEVQHGTLQAALVTHPGRTPVITATTISAAGLGLAMGATGLLAGVVGALVGGLDPGQALTFATEALWATLFTALAAMLGLGVGMAVRHGSAAISGLLAWWLVVENLLLVFLPERAAQFLPYVAGGGMLDIDSAWDFGGLTRAQNAATFSVYTAIALGIGALVVHRSDVT